MDIFSFLEWTEFQAEALLMNLLRSAWEPGDVWEPCGQSSQMLLVVEIMLQQQHVLHKGPQPHQTSIPKAQNMLQISA